MGAADGVSAAAPASTTGQPFEWRRTPISGNGTSTNPDSADKESQLAPGWDHLLGLALKDDWNRMLEVPMAGCKVYGFKELVRVGPGLLEDMSNPMDFMSDPRQESSCRRHSYLSIKYSFVDGPVFEDCVIDPTMFHRLTVSPPKNRCPFAELRDLEDKEDIQQTGGFVGKELEGYAVVKLDHHIVIHPKDSIAVEPAIETAPSVALGYQPTNIDAEFPDLGEASVSTPKKPVVKKIPLVQKSPKPIARQGSFDYRNKRANLIGKEYLNSQLDKVLEEKKTTPVEKKGNVAKPSTAHISKLVGHQGYQHRRRFPYINNFVPQQPIILLRREPTHVPIMRSGASSVINKDGITNNFQASHGYRQWKRVKEDDSSTTTSN